MKNLRKLLTVGLLVIFMSCGNGRNNNGTNDNDNSSTTATNRDYQTGTETNRSGNTSSDRMDNNSTNRGTTNDRMDNTSTTGNNTTDRMNNNSDYGSTEYDRTRMNNLYTHLNFTDDQIKRYEQTSRQNMDNWRRSNPNSTLSAQQRMQLENENMKGFLDSNQYSSYQQWVRDNPYKN